MLPKHWPLALCLHGVGSEHAQSSLRTSPRGEVPKATALARRAEMRSIIIIFIVRVLCLSARQGGVCGAGQMNVCGLSAEGVGELAMWASGAAGWRRLRSVAAEVGVAAQVRCGHVAASTVRAGDERLQY